MNKILMVLMIAFILVLPISVADVDYTEAGEQDGFFIRGNGVFNANLDPSDITISTAVLGDPEQIPLVFDLDGDGVQEIIVINDETITIFQNKTLDVLALFALTASADDTFSNMIVFDIDGDGAREIIVASEAGETLHILNYSSTSLIVAQNTISLSGLTHSSVESVTGQITIGCESTDRCLMTYSDIDRPVDSTGVFASFFNSSFVGNEILLQGSTTTNVFCPPKIRRMAIANYDFNVDSDVEFISTYIRPGIPGGVVSYFVFWINVESDNTLTEELQSSFSEGNIFTGATNEFECDNSFGGNSFSSSGGFGDALPGKFVTSPLTYDADPSTIGLETIIGFMEDNNEFKLKMFKADGSERRSFPSVQDSEGQILSNVFRAEIFDDSTSETDFCVLSQDITEQEHLIVTCGSLTDTNGVGIFNTQTIEFRSDDLSIFNVTDDFNHWGIVAHSGEYDSSNSVSEIISTWGVLEPVFDGILCTFGIDAVDCGLDLIFTNPATITDGTVVPVDLDNNDLEDFLVLTQTNLFYADDGFSNQPVNAFCLEPGSVTGTCTQYATNPCIDSVWKINTSVEITITPIDPEADLVQVSATLYDGDSNQLTQTSGNVSSGTTVPFSFTANKTIGAGTLTLTAVDIVENPTTIRTVTKSFSVASTGVEFNDCTSEFIEGVVTAEEEAALLIAEGSLTVDATENSIIRGLATFTDLTDLSGTSIWLVLMIIFSVGVYVRAAQVNWSAGSALGAIGVLNALFIILGARLGILSTSLVVIIVLLGVIILGVFLGRFFTGTSATSD